MKRALLVLIMMLFCISVNAQRTSVETIYGYLRVFPEDLGDFESVPNTVINQLNNQAIHGYNTWRIPTNEELSLLKAKGYLSGGTYMTKENAKGIVLLVTDGMSEYERTHVRSNGHDWVDLGLSVKWATYNVGASSPEEYGDYFAWGETSTKTEYTEDNSKTYGKSVGNEIGDIKGYSNYDAARANWGGAWRMPTIYELRELRDECIWTWTMQNGVKGYKVTGPNGNYIFLPAAGYRSGSSLNYAGSNGYYWSSTPDGTDYDAGAYYLDFGSDSKGVNYNLRDFGLSVRPVLE